MLLQRNEDFQNYTLFDICINFVPRTLFAFAHMDIFFLFLRHHQTKNEREK